MILLDGKEVQWDRYPNGEVGYFDSDNVVRPSHTLKLVWESDEDLIRLMFIKRHIDETYPGGNVYLTISYMPYSRMDRSDAGSCFTLKYVSELINSLNFQQVVVVEPHSDVTMALLNRSQPDFPIEWLYPEVIRPAIKQVNDGPTFMVYPDAGAAKRYGSKLSVYTHDKDRNQALNPIVFNKTRDFRTGAINGIQIANPASHLLGKANALIVDDLCSKGGTFMGAGNKLREIGFEHVFSYVTHLEETVFQGYLLDGDSPIEHIFTTDAYPTARKTGGWAVNKSKRITVCEL